MIPRSPFAVRRSPSRVLAAAALILLAACPKGEPARPAPPAFDAERAMEDVRAQVGFGFRIPGTEAHVKTGDWIVGRLRGTADTVIEQTWNHRTASGATLPMRNILARFRPEAAERVLLLAHWDTRPRSDSPTMKDSARMKLPVPGANDGASGVAVLLGIADALKKTPPGVGVDLLFVDGEDYGSFSDRTDVLVGSTYFASNLPSPDYRPIFGVLVDMVGDASLRIPVEGYSQERAPEVVRRVWETARELGYDDIFVQQNQGGVTDDHLPLLEKGLRVINVIDLDYPAHHTPDDTVDKVSGRSMQIVGEVLLRVLQGLGGA